MQVAGRLAVDFMVYLCSFTLNAYSSNFLVLAKHASKQLFKPRLLYIMLKIILNFLSFHYM